MFKTQGRRAEGGRSEAATAAKIGTSTYTFERPMRGKHQNDRFWDAVATPSETFRILQWVGKKKNPALAGFGMYSVSNGF
jgi:hypothetical protein